MVQHAPVEEVQPPPQGAAVPRSDVSPWWNAGPWVLFALLVAWKLTFLGHLSVGFGTYDEIVYFKYATQLASGHMFHGAEYPWLYPVALLPAFLFNDPRVAGVALSAVYSATLVFPVWLIAREILDARHATVIAALTCLLPHQYILSRSLMSEQIYFPMLLFAVYLVTTERWNEHRVLRDVLTGALAGAMYATRFLTVPILPALVVVWWVREAASTGRLLPSAKALGRLALAGAAGFAVFAPWLVAARSVGTPLRLALGLEIARSKLATTVHPTTAGLFTYGALYVAAWALSLFPLLGGVGFATLRAVRKGARDPLGRLAIAAAVLAGSLLVVLTRHSWLATYNYPSPLRIMVRYGIYVTGLGFVLGYAGLVKYLESRPLPRVTAWAVALVVPVAAIVVGWWLQIGSGFLPNVGVSVDGSAGDVSRIPLMGVWFWIVGLSTLAVTAWLVVRRDRRAIAALAVGCVVFYSIAIPTYVERLDQFHVYQVLAYRIAAIEKARPSAEKAIYVALAPDAVAVSGVTERGFYKSLEWNLQYFSKRPAASLPLRSMPKPTYVIHAAAAFDGTGTPVEVQGERYVIERRSLPAR